MRSKALWAAFALVAVLGITSTAGATTHWLITGKQIAPHTISSKHLVDHTIQAHDLSNRLVRSLHGQRGTPGPAGPIGNTGPVGPAGPVGPSSGTMAGQIGSYEPSTLGFSQLGSSGTLTLQTPGKVVVEMSGYYFLACGPDGGCSNVISAFVDSTPVPGAYYAVGAGASSTARETFAVSGMAVDVPAGTHTVTVEVRSDANVISTASDNLHLTAVALGND